MGLKNLLAQRRRCYNLFLPPPALSFREIIYAISTIFLLVFSPRTMRSDDLGTAKCLASRATTASLACPSRAGARTHTTYSVAERFSILASFVVCFAVL